ncbi:MAG: ADP-ribosylglycohydrolase family protein [Patescibacteria group bacterium]|jgi:ADP-ribosylglycohydrolase
MKDKVRGAIVGVAIGDALGMPVEGLLPNTIKKHFGIINSYRTPNPKCRSTYYTLKRGQWTDDTQLTVAIGESIVANNGINYDDIAIKHVQASQVERRGWGKATLNGCQKILSGVNWWESEEKDAAGNGPPMKISPIGILYGLDIINKFELITACINISKMTHGDPRATTTAILHAYLIGRALKGNIETLLFDIEELPIFAEQIEEVFNEDILNKELFFRKLEYAINLARDKSDQELREKIGVKSFVNESVAFTYAMIFKYGKNLQDCLEKIINQGGDADTTGALAGSILGAVYGYSQFPERWRWGVEDRVKLVKLADDLFALSKKRIDNDL